VHLSVPDREVHATEDVRNLSFHPCVKIPYLEQMFGHYRCSNSYRRF